MLTEKNHYQIATEMATYNIKLKYVTLGNRLVISPP